jgi:TetR/AcrR family transcriptional regulator, transcriptional repressor for nem operon
MSIVGQVTDSFGLAGVVGPAGAMGSAGTAGAPTGGGKRERLVAAARAMIHEQGVEKTTLADIADRADVPVGNIYYYFKTKDALVSAVLDAYRTIYGLLSAELDQQPTPQARLKALVRVLTERRELLTARGCPVGSLSSELDKRDDALRTQGATVLSLLVDWAEEQFRELGRDDARELAVALIAAYEGVALLASTLRDPGLISTEAARLERWIDTLVQ